MYRMDTFRIQGGDNLAPRREARRPGWLVVLWFCLVMATTACPADLNPEDLYQQVLPSVFTLEVETWDGTRVIGSGFLAFEDGMAVTVWHAVRNAKRVSARFADQRVVEVIGMVDRDETRDLALIRLNTTNRPLSRLAAKAPRIGAKTYTVGAPRGFEFSIADGLVSQVQVVDGFEQYQVTCPISPGNSGGPILNREGEVLGVVAWSRKDGQNLNFATPAKWLLALDRSRPATPWERALREHKPLARVDHPERDELTEQQPIKNLTELRRTLRSAAGETVTVRVLRAGEEQTFTIRVPKDFVR